MPERVAEITLDAMRTNEPFLILPHDRVAVSFARKGADYEGWLAHTRRRLADLQR